VRWAWYAGAFGVGVLSAGTKQIAATLPFFVLLYEWYFFRGLERVWAKRFFLYLIGPVIALVILSVLYTGLNPFQKLLSTSVDVDYSVVERFLTQFRVVFHYISLLVYPHPSRLNLDYDFLVSQSLFQPVSTFFSVMGVIGLSGLAIFLAKRHRLASFCILWFLGNLVIESFVASLEMVYEHRTYLPSMFVFTPVVVTVYRYGKYKTAALAAAAIIVTVFSVWTYERNRVWSDPVALWRGCAEKSTKKARPFLNLASALASRGRVDKAIPYYREAIRRRPDYEHAHIGLGSALIHKGRLDEALDHYLEALRIRPEHAMVHYGLGVVNARRGELGNAVRHYKKALALKADYAKAMNGLGVVAAKQGRWNNAVRHFKKGLRIKPDFSRARKNLQRMRGLRKHG
jgi:protein O-mannosyl-transferase